MGEDTHTQKNTLIRTHTSSQCTFWLNKWSNGGDRGGNRETVRGRKITVTTKLQRLLMSPKIQLNKLFKL